ncbi:MAG: hypothetical protein KIS78_32015 [Labilithrix sp.]|nr:hypothetical protein [Labilithrix sp.]MCW5837064.1 hypothetical protein [Labilithrix sp.]
MTLAKKPNATASIFANALASTPSSAGAGVSAGMHNTLTCDHCGAGRERAASERGAGALVCRYCGTPFSAKPPSR